MFSEDVKVNTFSIFLNFFFVCCLWLLLSLFICACVCVVCLFVLFIFCFVLFFVLFVHLFMASFSEDVKVNACPMLFFQNGDH